MNRGAAVVLNLPANHFSAIRFRMDDETPHKNVQGK